METMTVTNEKTLQQGLNDVVINKVQKMIDGKAVGVQATMERLINEGKIAQDYIAPIGVNLRQKDHSPVITFNGGDDKLVMNMPDGQFSLHDNAIGQLATEWEFRNVISDSLRKGLHGRKALPQKS